MDLGVKGQLTLKIKARTEIVYGRKKSAKLKMKWEETKSMETMAKTWMKTLVKENQRMVDRIRDRDLIIAHFHVERSKSDRKIVVAHEWVKRTQVYSVASTSESGHNENDGEHAYRTMDSGCILARMRRQS
mmetsp:Transcript_28676/g.53730  ORF Transcript_28676/g.53730 Transcript_28676/m.53730 type:complete len:131 (-) Transcript_28676:1814-2206(-)